MAYNTHGDFDTSDDVHLYFDWLGIKILWATIALGFPLLAVKGGADGVEPPD